MYSFTLYLHLITVLPLLLDHRSFNLTHIHFLHILITLHRSADVILRLYLALIGPHSDFAVQFWLPYYRIEIAKLIAVQIRMTKMIQWIRNLTYKDRLKRLTLHS